MPTESTISPDNLDRTLTARHTVLPRIEATSGKARLLTTRERRYDILRPLGEGGAGEVFLAEDRDIGRKVAIKQIREDVRSEALLVRFIREVQTVGRLEHPNIVPIHDVGQDEHGAYYFVMKYVEGLTLEQIIDDLRRGDAATHRRFGVEQRVKLARSLMEAVAFAHSHGVIHRDLKPANIMVGRYGEVLVLDWGIAKIDGTIEPAVNARPEDQAVGPHTRDGALIGTPRYMSPEQAQGLAVDHRSDIYSLSVILHELLTLRHYLDAIPDEAGLEAVLTAVREQRVPLASLVRHPHQDPIPMDLSWIVDQGVKKQPSERYASVDILLARLSARDAGEIHVQCPVTFSKRASFEVFHVIDRFVVPRMGWMFTAGAAALTIGTALLIAMMVTASLVVLALVGVGAYALM